MTRRHSTFRTPHSAFVGPRAPCPQPLAFSLIELMISMAILSVGLIAAMRVFPIGLRASKRAELASRAAIMAQRTIESLKLEPWEALAPGETEAEEEGFAVRTRIRESAFDSLTDPARLKIVEVTVRSEEGGRSRELAFITYVRRGRDEALQQ